MSIIYMITGSTGAGKSTYARKLAKEKHCIRFAIDEWMVSLFAKDQPDPIEYQWALERTERIEDQIIDLLKQYEMLGLSAILDLGFFQKNHRKRVRDAVEKIGFSTELHYLDYSPEVRWQRVEQRNREKGETFSLIVTKDMFDFCEDLFEAPEQRELDGIIITK